MGIGSLGGSVYASNHGCRAGRGPAARRRDQCAGRTGTARPSAALCLLAALLAPGLAHAQQDAAEPDPAEQAPGEQGTAGEDSAAQGSGKSARGELAALIEQGRFEVAYDLAESQFAERAGETRFDFYYGLAALETGHVNRAIFAFERVLIRAPGLDRARLELARALYLQGDDLRARREFETVLAHDPPPEVVERVELYLAAMERRADRYRTKVTGWVEAEVGHDDNVNRAPDVETIGLDFGTLILDPSQQERESEFISSAAALQISRPLKPGLNLIGAIDAEGRSAANESQFDTRFARGQVGLRRLTGQHLFTGFLEAYRFYVGGDPYQGAGGFNLSYSYAVDDDLSLYTAGQVLKLEYDTLELQDATIGYLELGFTRNWSARFDPQTQLGLLLGREEAEDNSVEAEALASRDIIGFSAWLGLSPLPDWGFQARLRFQRSEYESDLFPFSEAREEDYYSLDLALDWYPDAHWRIGPHLEYSNNSANLEVYDYERAAVGVRARYTFF